MNIHHSKKLVTRQIGAPEPFFALDSKGIATLNTMYSIVIKEKNYSEKFVLGICNSLLIKYWWLSRFSDNKALFPKIKGFQLKQIPIPTATPTQQQPIISLVDSILAAKKKDPSADTSKQEAEIDRLVYKLYDLTDEEIAIVEGRDSIASLQNDNVVGKLQNDHNVKELQNDNVAKDLQNNVVGELQNDCTKKSPATASNDSWLQGEEL